MAGLAQHMQTLFMTTPESSPGNLAPAPLGGTEPADTATAPVAEATPIDTTVPNTTTTPISPALRSWLIQQRSGHNVLTPEMYQYLGGDALLAQLQQFDPDARWVPSEISGGEGGSSGQGVRLEFDPAKLPAVAGPGGGKSIYEAGLVPVYSDSQLHNPGMIYDDPYYGRLTPQQNVVKQKEAAWVKWAPLVVAGAATLGAATPAIAAAEAGAGAAAGYGSAAAGAANAATPWWAQVLGKLPQVANTASKLAAPTGVTNPDAYNAAAYNNMGSAAKPTSNESSLVATQFADDPYRFSNSQQ